MNDRTLRTTRDYFELTAPETIEHDLGSMLYVKKNESDYKGDVSLFDAISYSKSPQVIRAVISGGADVNDRTETSGTPPLHYAIGENQNLGIIKTLLDAGADVNGPDRDGESPLHWAVDVESHDIVKCLLGAGADATARDRNGQTPLHFAAAGNEKPEIIKTLLDAGIPVDILNLDSETPLEYGLSIGQITQGAIKELLEGGADIENLSDEGKRYLEEIMIGMDAIFPMEDELYELGSLRRDACKLTALAEGRYKTAGTFHCIYRGIHICRVEEIFGREHVLYLVETAPETTFRGTEEAKEEIDRFWRRWEGTNLAMRTKENHDARMAGREAKHE